MLVGELVVDTGNGGCVFKSENWEEKILGHMILSLPSLLMLITPILSQHKQQAESAHEMNV